MRDDGVILTRGLVGGMRSLAGTWVGGPLGGGPMGAGAGLLPLSCASEGMGCGWGTEAAARDRTGFSADVAILTPPAGLTCTAKPSEGFDESTVVGVVSGLAPVVLTVGGACGVIVWMAGGFVMTFKGLPVGGA